MRPADILQLQKTMGNAAVAQLAQGASTPSVSSSRAPIQRVDTKVAEQHLFTEFGANATSAVWNILVQWLAGSKLKVSQIGIFTFIGYVEDIKANLNKMFPTWLQERKLTPKDDKGKGDLFFKYVVELSTATPGSDKYLDYILAQPLNVFNWTDDDLSEDYEPDEVEDDDEDVPDDDVTVDDPTPEELLRIAETGKKAEEMEFEKQTAIDNITKSDATFEPEQLDDILKKHKHLKEESERRQFKKKGSQEFTMRPKGTGTARIVTESFLDPYTKKETARTVIVESEVIPMRTTGRPAAPEPSSGLRVGTSAKGFTRKGASATDEYNNQGFVDAQKGHIIALELGGPDVPKNIVPQWGNWQGNGVWRKMEVHILDTAKEVASNSKKKASHSVQMRVYVHYKSTSDDSLASFRSLAFPTHFTVQVWEIDSTTKDAVSGVRYQKTLNAAQDHTDDKMMFRQDHALMVSQKQESPYGSELTSRSSRKRKTVTRKGGATAKTPRSRKAVTTTPSSGSVKKPRVRKSKATPKQDKSEPVKKINKKKVVKKRRKSIG